MCRGKSQVTPHVQPVRGQLRAQVSLGDLRFSGSHWCRPCLLTPWSPFVDVELRCKRFVYPCVLLLLTRKRFLCFRFALENQSGVLDRQVTYLKKKQLKIIEEKLLVSVFTQT